MADDRYQVKVKEGPSKGKSFDVKSEALVLGTGPGADIIVEGPGVEARHAQIVFQGGQVKLEDLETQSGTFRNGQRLLAAVQVFPGDRIGLGPEVILILQGDDPREGAAALDELAGDEGVEKA